MEVAKSSSDDASAGIIQFYLSTVTKDEQPPFDFESLFSRLVIEDKISEEIIAQFADVIDVEINEGHDNDDSDSDEEDDEEEADETMDVTMEDEESDVDDQDEEPVLKKTQKGPKEKATSKKDKEDEADDVEGSVSYTKK